ncbi:MAG: restriction endonuclease subunit S [Pseudomonadota bacterium]|nr:restriction endonuclease subunit S [Pseudomonadota bacterium]
MRFQSTPLSEVCEVIMGQAPLGASYNENGEGLPLIAGAGDFGSVTPSPKKHTTAASKISQVGDLILCIRATIGDLNWGDKEYCLGRGVAGLRPKKSVLNKDYLWHFIQANKHQLSAKGTGSTFKQVSRSHIAEWEIPLPPLSEQKRIASILDKADAIHRKRQQAIQLADEFLRSVFLDMFGDPVTNSKGFEIKELSDFFIDNKNGTKCGPFGSALKKQEYTESGIPVWSMDNISLSGDFHDVPALWVSEEKFEELNSYSVLPGDVIISRAGTVGKMGVVRSHYEKSLISTNLIRVRFNERRLIPEYFVSLMTYCKGRVGRLKTGPDGAFTHMNTGILSSLTFPYPPIDLQKRFMEYRRKVISILDSSLEYEHEGSFALQAISRKAFSGTL